MNVAFDLQIIYHFQQYSIRLRYNRKLEAISLLTSGSLAYRHHQSKTFTHLFQPPNQRLFL